MKFLKAPLYSFLFAILLLSPFSSALAEDAAAPAQADDVKTTFQKSLETVKQSGQFSKGKKEKGDIVQEKKQFLQRLSQIVDQKLAILGKQNIPLSVLDAEIARSKKKLSEFAAEKKKIAKKKALYESKIKSIEQDISIKKQLSELTLGKDGELEKDIKKLEAKLADNRNDLDYLVQHESLVDLKNSLVQDYYGLVQRKRNSAINRILFTPSKLKLKADEASGLAVVGLFFLLLIIFRKKVSSGISQLVRGNSDLIALARLGLFLAFIYYIAYWAASIYGYHLLCRFITKRIAFSAGIITLAIAAYVLITVFVRRFLVRPVASISPGQTSKHPYFHIFCTLLGVAAFSLSIYWISDVWGAGAGGRETIWKLIQKPFFEAGEMKLSVWLIVKAMIIVWFLLAAAKVLDSFLYRRVYPRTQLDETIRYAFSVIIKYISIIVAGFTALKLLGVEIGALTVLAGTVGIGIGFGLQDLAKNFISGLVILVERPVKIGDYVEVGGVPGRVKTINARSTVVDTFDNISVLVPNSEFMSQNVTNWSYSDRITRQTLKIGVAYGSNLELVQKTLLDVASQQPKVLKHPEPTVAFEEFGESSLDFTLQIWTDDPSDRKSVRSDLNFQIDKAFREKGIEIPFPQRDLHIKSGNLKI